MTEVWSSAGPGFARVMAHRYPFARAGVLLSCGPNGIAATRRLDKMRLRTLLERLKTGMKDPHMRANMLALAGGKAIGLTLLLTAMYIWTAHAQTPAAAAAAPAAAPAPARGRRLRRRAITDADIKDVADAEAGGQGRRAIPAGTITGTAADIPVGDAKKGLTIGDVVNAGRPEPDRHQLHLDAGHRLPRHVHAGRLRDRRDRPRAARRTPTTP